MTWQGDAEGRRTWFSPVAPWWDGFLAVATVVLVALTITEPLLGGLYVGLWAFLLVVGFALARAAEERDP